MRAQGIVEARVEFELLPIHAECVCGIGFQLADDHRRPDPERSSLIADAAGGAGYHEFDFVPLGRLDRRLIRFGWFVRGTKGLAGSARVGGLVTLKTTAP